VNGSSVDADDPILWINDGRECLGRVYETGAGSFEAVSDAGAVIGTFPSADQAAAAIRAHASRSR
jgi:hypothetical protein